MKGLPKPSSVPARAPNPVVVVTLCATETSSLVRTTETSTPQGLMLEQEMQRRAEAMTTVLTQIMERPATHRHWGLNE